jgi:DNA-binding response OmpR family regulator
VPKILSFETDISALHDIALILTRTGVAVSSVSQKSEALRLAQNIAPDLLIVGPNVADSLRARITRTLKCVNPELKIVYLYERSLAAQGADAELSLEHVAEHLVATVRHLLDPTHDVLISA